MTVGVRVHATILFDGRFQNLYLLPCQRSTRLSDIHIGQNTVFQENSDTGSESLGERKNVRNTEKNMENRPSSKCQFPAATEMTRCVFLECELACDPCRLANEVVSASESQKNYGC